MKVYLAATRPARPVALDLDGPLIDVALPAASGPWRRSEWRCPDASTVLIAWSNEPDDPRLLPPLLARAHAAVGCPGHLGDVHELERLLDAADPGAVADELAGVFGVFRADARGFHAITTLVRIHPVFHATVGDVHLAGNRALVVHAAARAIERGDGTPAVRYDVPALQSLVRNGYFLSDDTPFEGVHALPAHTTLRVIDGAPTIVTRPLPDGETATVDGFVDTLRATVAPLRAFAEPIQLSLTGGRDSRLLAAILHAAGVNVRTTTTGFPDHPDVVLAARIAQLLGLEHRNVAPKRDAGGEALVVEHPSRRAWELLRATEGMISAHNNVTRPRPFKLACSISGLGGEQLRGGFLVKQGNVDPPALARRVRALFTTAEPRFTDAANDRARGDLAPWAATDPLIALDRLYLYYRSGRWSAASLPTLEMNHPTFNLLFDNRLNRLVVAMSPAWRWTEQPFHEAIARLAPGLRDVPLTDRRWRYDARRPMWLFRRAWSRREPLRVVKTAAGFDWRNQPSAELLALLREQILDGPSGLFEILRRPAVEALLAAPPAPADAVFLWNAYTASVLLSGAWLGEAPSAPALSITVPRATLADAAPLP